MDKWDWQDTVHRAAKSWTWLHFDETTTNDIMVCTCLLFFCWLSFIHSLHHGGAESSLQSKDGVLPLLLHTLSTWQSLVQFSHSVMSDSLWCHELQQTRPPCPSPTPGVYSNSSPLSRWCHSTVSSSVFPFSSCPQSFLASGSFQMSQLFASGGQSIGVSASTSVLPWWDPGLVSFRMDWLNLLAVQGTLKSILQHHSSKASILRGSAFFIVQLSHPYMTTGKAIALTRQTFVDKVMSPLFNMLLPRSKSLNFMAAVTICSDFGAQKNKVSHCFPIYGRTISYLAE